jgi:hypothetical protein
METVTSAFEKLTYREGKMARDLARQSIEDGTFDRKKAALAAGYAPSTARAVSYQKTKDADFVAAIEEEEARILSNAGISKELLLGRMKRLVEANPEITGETHLKALLACLKGYKMFLPDDDKNNKPVNIQIVLGEGYIKPEEKTVVDIGGTDEQKTTAA